MYIELRIHLLSPIYVGHFGVAEALGFSLSQTVAYHLSHAYMFQGLQCSA